MEGVLQPDEHHESEHEDEPRGFPARHEGKRRERKRDEGRDCGNDRLDTEHAAQGLIREDEARGDHELHGAEGEAATATATSIAQSRGAISLLCMSTLSMPPLCAIPARRAIRHTGYPSKTRVGITVRNEQPPELVVN